MVDVLGEVTRNERLRTMSKKQHQRWTRFLARIIAEGCASGEFAAVDPEITATQMAALIDGLAIQTTLQNPILPPEKMRQICLAALQRFLTHE
ncbi:MAG TPA: TetR family transcriptional regulator C-terminal domain-containing protein [Ktedonobacteraceae bacterium]|nr:TetR family transcriptional regulator C-terminal domain-containing protein [Ktedonobacteraceae bacterium]